MVALRTFDVAFLSSVRFFGPHASTVAVGSEGSVGWRYIRTPGNGRLPSRTNRPVRLPANADAGGYAALLRPNFALKRIHRNRMAAFLLLAFLPVTTMCAFLLPALSP